MKNRYLVLAAAVILALAFSAYGQSAASWVGNVTIGSTNASDGTNVLAFNGSTQLAATTVGEFKSGAYLLSVACSSGQGIQLKVYDLSALNTTCTPGAQTGSNLSVNTTANGVACNFAGSCSSGFCTDGYCCNSACGSGSACNIAGSLGTCTSTGGGSGGGGTSGGGGGAAAPPAPVANATATVSTPVSAGENAVVSFTTDDAAKIAVESVQITVNEAVQSVSVTVKETTQPPAGPAVSSVQDGVYKYLNITPTVGNDKISSAKIQFKVPKAWFDANLIDPATVVLKKNEGATWNNVPTVQLNFDGTYYYYESTTTSFSIYAITGKAAQAAPQPPPQQGNGTTPPPSQGNGSAPPPATPPPSYDNTALLIGVVIVIIIILGIALHFKKKPKVNTRL